MKGVWPDQYHSDPYPNKTIEAIWDDLDAYSFEEMYEMPKYHESLRFYVPLPPLFYKGHFTKGICFTQGAHFLLERLPDLKKLFFVVANSMCFSYPWAHDADCFMTCYRNPKREAYYKKKYPATKDIICLPLQDSDYTDEKRIMPIPNTPKTIDVFCVSTAFPVKNLPMIAKALKAYEKKYKKRLKVVYAIGDNAAKRDKNGNFDYSGVSDYSKNVLKEVEEILGDIKSYIDFHPYIEYYKLPEYFSAAKCGVLGSLIEGKNRFLSEGMSCDMPVIVFRDFNKFTRGDSPAFYGNAGEYAPEFTPESLAETIHKVITNPQNYNPRDCYLRFSGRHNFINTCINEIPYYREHLPEFNNGHMLQNNWVNEACLHNYGMSYESFLYDLNANWSNVVGKTKILELLKKFYEKMNIPWCEFPEELCRPIR